MGTAGLANYLIDVAREEGRTEEPRESNHVHVVWHDEEARDGTKVVIDLTGVLEDGTPIDVGLIHPDPIEFVIGSQTLPASIEEAVCGMKCGQRTTVEIPASEAFGEYDESLVRRVPRANLAVSEQLQEDAHIVVEALGTSLRAKVVSLDEATALIDFNHDLAGHDLRLEISLVSVSHPSAVEREKHAAGCGCGCDTLKRALASS